MPCRLRAWPLLASLLIVPTSPLHAQPAHSQAAAAGTQQYDLAPGPLGDTLTRIAQQSGSVVSLDPVLVRGMQSAPLRGRYTAEQAMRRALAGTPLELVVTANGTFSVRRAPAAPAATLEPIQVLGNAETALGHVAGYVARRNLSATKTDTALLETPQSVSVVTSDQIQAVKANSMADALDYTPGFAAQSPAFSRMVDDFMLRGFNVATGNSGLLRDGLKLQSNVYDGGQEPYGLERVEVLRGASSVLYGQLSPGGVVNAISKRPTLEPLRELSLDVGSYDRRQLSGDFSGRLTEDGQWSYRLTGLAREGNNWVDHVPDDRVYLAPALTWRPSAATSVALLASYQHIRTRFSAPLPADYTLNDQIPRDLFIGEPDFDRYDTDTYTVGYAIEHAFNERVKLRHSARYFNAQGRWDYLTFGSLVNGRTINRGVSSRKEDSYGIATDTSLEVKLDTGALRHTLLGGFDYYRGSYESHRYRGTVAPLPDMYDPVYGAIPNVNRALDTGLETRSDSMGLYLQDQMQIGGNWTLLLGGRQDWVRTRQASYTPAAAARLHDASTTGRVGLVYVADNGLAPYVSASQSFAPTIGADRAGNAFKPTKGTQYELGLRYEPPGSNMLFSAAVYDLTQTNALTPDPADPTYSVQNGKARSRGLELEARVDLGALRVLATYAYTDARTVRSNDPTLVDQRVTLVPLHSASLWTEYNLTAAGAPGLTLGAGLRYASSTNLPGYGADVPGRLLVDAMAAYEFGELDPGLAGLSLTVNARNLFNRGYLSCAGSTGCRYGEPRTLYATMSYRW